MLTSARLTSDLARLTLWLSTHPRFIQIAFLVLPLTLALLAGLFSVGTAHACPLASGGSGCGG